MAVKLVRIAELQIDPDQIDAYRALLCEEMEASLDREPGVLQLQAVAERGRPERLYIFEVYANREAYEAHLTTPHFLKYKEATAAMVKALRLIDVDPIMLRAE
jgi:quinol monooxygenase YgiN